MAKLLIENGAVVDYKCNVSIRTGIAVLEWWCMSDLNRFDDYSCNVMLIIIIRLSILQQIIIFLLLDQYYIEQLVLV